VAKFFPYVFCYSDSRPPVIETIAITCAPSTILQIFNIDADELTSAIDMMTEIGLLVLVSY
jgi:hypothetical protein